MQHEHSNVVRNARHGNPNARPVSDDLAHLPNVTLTPDVQRAKVKGVHIGSQSSMGQKTGFIGEVLSFRED